MKYKAYLYQEGGCDYTIGCGIRVIDIEASNIEEAHSKLKEEILENYNFSETRLAECELYEVNQVIICDVEDWYDEFAKEKSERDQKLKEDIEYQNYLNLKSKYEK